MINPESLTGNIKNKSISCFKSIVHPEIKVVIIYFSSCRFKPYDFLSSMEHKRLFFMNILALVFNTYFNNISHTNFANYIFSVISYLIHKQIIIYDYQAPGSCFCSIPSESHMAFFLSVCNVFSVVREKFVNVASVHCHVFTMTVMMSGVENVE